MMQPAADSFSEAVADPAAGGVQRCRRSIRPNLDTSILTTIPPEKAESFRQDTPPARAGPPARNGPRHVLVA
jgi:hypothetical protein